MMPVIFVACVRGLYHNLSGCWGPFYTEKELHDFMKSKDMGPETYGWYMVNNPDSAGLTDRKQDHQ